MECVYYRNSSLQAVVKVQKVQYQYQSIIPITYEQFQQQTMTPGTVNKLQYQSVMPGSSVLVQVTTDGTFRVAQTALNGLAPSTPAPVLSLGTSSRLIQPTRFVEPSLVSRGRWLGCQPWLASRDVRLAGMSTLASQQRCQYSGYDARFVDT